MALGNYFYSLEDTQNNTELHNRKCIFVFLDPSENFAQHSSDAVCFILFKSVIPQGRRSTDSIHFLISSSANAAVAITRYVHNYKWLKEDPY